MHSYVYSTHRTSLDISENLKHLHLTLCLTSILIDMAAHEEARGNTIVKQN